jgi:hypothetical protein
VLAALVAWWGLTLGMAGRSAALFGERMIFWHDQEWFGAEYRVGEAPPLVNVGEVFRIPVTLRNTGTIEWPRAGDRPTHLAYHWEPLEGTATLTEFEGVRTELPSDVGPGDILRVVASVRAPPYEGSYRLRWDLVQEGITWFSERGVPMPEQQIEVTTGIGSLPPALEGDVAPPPVGPSPPSRPALWRAAWVLFVERPLLGIGPDNFRRRYQSILGAAPTGQPYTDTRLHANSLYFETLADLGVAGVGALALIAYALARSLRGHWRAASVAGLGCSVAASVFFVHGLLDYFFEFTPLFGLFWLLLGLSAACELERRNGETRGSPR